MIKLSSTKFFVFALCALVLDAVFCTQALADNPGWWNGTDPGEFADGIIQDTFCDVIGHIEGNMGGMIMAAAGILAFATAAFGDLKHGTTAIAVGIGAFSMSAMVSLYFGTFDCDGGATKRTAPAQRSINDAAIAIGAGRSVDYSFVNDGLLEQKDNSDPFGF